MKLIQEHNEVLATDTLRANQSRSDDVDLLELILELAERKWLIVNVTAGAAILALAIAFLIPNRYTATAMIMPPQQTGSTSALLMSQLAGSGLGSLATLAGKDFGLKDPNELYVGMLKSRTVQESIINKFQLQSVYRDKRMSDARKDLESYSEISAGKNGLIRISFEDKDPKRAADVTNAYINELRTLTQRLAMTEASQRRLFFERQVDQAKDDLAVAEVALKNTQQKTGMFQLEGQAKAIIEAIGTLRGRISATEVQLHAMRSFATDENPDVLLAEQQLAGLRAQLEKLERQQPSETGDPLLATSNVPAVALEYIRRLRDVKYREAVFEVLAKQFEAAKLDEAKQAAVIQVVDPAVSPDKKSSPHRMIIVLGASCLGLFGSCVLIIAAESMRRVQQKPRVAEQIRLLKQRLRS